MSAAAPDPPAKRLEPAGRGKTALRISLLLVAAVTVLPYLARFEPGRSWVLRRIFPTVQGLITATDARFGWTAPTQINGLEIRSPSGDPVVAVESIQIDVPFWRFIFPTADMGRLVLHKPHVTIVIHDQDKPTNLAETFPPESDSSVAKRKRHVRAALGIQVEDATLSWVLPSSKETWGVDHIHFNGRLAPEALDGTPRSVLIVEPAMVLDHAKLTPGMCREVFVYAAPVLAHATTVEGEISLELESGEFPLDDPRQGTLRGELTMHHVAAGAGPFIAAIKKALPAAFQARELPQLKIEDESMVTFEMADGRVSHRDLAFVFGTVAAATEGSVGFDRSLDLQTFIHLDVPPEQVVNRPVLRALSEHGLRLPIKGTLDTPLVDPKLLEQESLDLLGTALENWRNNRPESPVAGSAQQIFELLRQRGVFSPPSPPAPRDAAAPGTPPAGNLTAEDAVEIGKSALGVIQNLAKKRREKLEQDAKSNPGSTGETPKKRPLDKLLDRLKSNPPTDPKPEPKP